MDIISGYIRNQRQNIKKGASGEFIPVIYMTMLVVCVLVKYSFSSNVIQYSYENIENGLVEALLASSLPNLTEYEKNGWISFMEGENNSSGYYYFDRAYKSFADSLYSNIDNNLEIKKFIIYNYIQEDGHFRIIETGIDNGMKYVTEHAKDEKCLVYANDRYIEINRTSIYGEIEFSLEVIDKINMTDNERYVLKRMTGIDKNE